MSETDTAQTMGEILAASGMDDAADSLADSVAESTRLAAAVGDENPLPFADASDAWSFALAFVAATIAVPIADLLAMSLDEFLRWHRQAVRLRIGQHQVAAALIGAIAAQTALPTTTA